eukprot:TRINITY_DN36223_c0_g1_i1.p1 TRINITY_DN36223_c0_g1~~TRINITY_DN36223_c0_g1_i1.p1  ORF type:complete len:335 (-),score=18.99 TRINITY_DN36223_c0_g1_i1:362-1318(-)
MHKVMASLSAQSLPKRREAACFGKLSLGRLLLCFATAPLFTFFPRQTRYVRGAALLRNSIRSAEQPKAPCEFRLQLGRAIDTLRIDVAQLFDRGRKRPDLSLFSDDVTFAVQSMPSLSLNGLDMYNRTLRFIRWSVKSMRNSSQMKIIAFHQTIDTMLYVRWQFRVRPKDALLAVAAQTSYWDSTEQMVLLEGLSKYELHPSTALIVRHTVEFTNPPLYLSELPKLFPAPRDILLAQPELAHSAVKAWSFEMGTFSFPLLPATCEDDFECNNGTANYPLQCLHPHECMSTLPEIFIMGRYCCEPPVPSEPIRVRVPAK